MSEQESTLPAITSAKEWAERNLNIRPITLPGGAVFRVKNVDLPTMVSKGHLPMELVNHFIGMAATVAKNRAKKKTDLDGVAEKDLSTLDGVCRKFAAVAIIEPRVSATEPTSDDVVNVNDLSFEDVLFVFSQCVKGGGAAFANFFRGGHPGPAPGPDVAGLRAETVKPGWDHG